MANGFEVALCAQETCDGIRLVDQTGFFATDKPYGYNGPADAIPTLATDGTFGYDEYQLQLFFAIAGGFDSTGTPDFTADLLTWPHTIDTTTGYVTWEFSFEDLGVDTLRSGWWLFRLNPVTWDNTGGPYDYANDYQFGFVGDLRTKLNPLMLAADFTCACKEGCMGIEEIWAKFELTEVQGCCQQDANFQTNVDWLYDHYSLCCG